MSLYTRDGTEYTEVGHNGIIFDGAGVKIFVNNSDISIAANSGAVIGDYGTHFDGGLLVIDDLGSYPEMAEDPYRNCRSCGQMYPLDSFVGGCPSCGAPMEAR